VQYANVAAIPTCAPALTRSPSPGAKERRHLGAVVTTAYELEPSVTQTSPGSHGKLSRYAVPEGRGISLAVARKGDDALREIFSFFLCIVGQMDAVADLIEHN